jgi:hypothetical protein
MPDGISNALIDDAVSNAVQLGLRTYRRTFRQLHGQLSSGPDNSLQLEYCGRIHVVYLRAGYQYQDYLATDLDTRRCCDALRETRLFVRRRHPAPPGLMCNCDYMAESPGGS